VNVAWFSPLPPDRSGIAAYSAELLPLLRARGLVIDTFTEAAAHDFVWRHRRNAYDVTVFHLGNARCHDYMWAYLFRYPGLLVLHDAQLHQARALALTRRWVPRRADYLAEFRANHPDAPVAIGEVVAAGFGGSLYHHWPMTRLAIDSARLTVVHNARLEADLREVHPAAPLQSMAMGVADPWAGLPQNAGRDAAPGHDAAHARARHGIPRDALVLAAFGGVTPEKRIGALLRAVSTLGRRHERLRLLLVGSTASYFDVGAEAARWGVADRVHITGYVADADLSGCLSAADVCACLRWPTNRETSASWLRCLAAGRPTLISDLSDLVDVPTLDPRGWRVHDTSSPSRPPVAVGIDLVDEDHALQQALDRLLTDPDLRASLGRAGRAWWQAHHQLDAMADAYARVIVDAMAAPTPVVDLPPHLTEDGLQVARDVATQLHVASRLSDLLHRP
jgi:glycosyltransferase involved in cell wall biosynthesis